MMKHELKNKLFKLKSEFESGNQRLVQIEDQANALRNNLLRTAGAIQVLEEMLAEQNAEAEEQQKVEQPLTSADSKVSDNGK